MVDGAADQLAMSELAVLSADHWSVSGVLDPTTDAFDDVPEVGRRNLSPSSSAGGSQPVGPKSTMLMIQCPLGKYDIGAVLAVPSGKGSACNVQASPARSMRNPSSFIRFIGKKSGTAACSESRSTFSFRIPLSPAIPAGTSMAPAETVPPPIPEHLWASSPSTQTQRSPKGWRLSVIFSSWVCPTQPSSAAVSTMDSPALTCSPMNWAA